MTQHGDKNRNQSNKTIHSIGSAVDQVEEFIRRGDEVAADLREADLANVAGKIKQLQVDFDRDTTEIAQQLAMYLNPEAKISVAILKAARIVHDNVRSRRSGELPFGGGYPGSLPGVPSVPSVASLYINTPIQERQQVQTVSLPPSPTTAPQNENTGSKPQGFGSKAATTAGKS